MLRYAGGDASDELLREMGDLLEGLRAELGSDHPDVVGVEFNLGLVLVSRGQSDEAIRLLGRNLDMRSLVLGDRHPDVLEARVNLAAALRRAGRLDESIRRCVLVIRDPRQILGEDHPATLTAENNLATAYTEIGNTDSAIAWLTAFSGLGAGCSGRLTQVPCSRPTIWPSRLRQQVNETEHAPCSSPRSTLQYPCCQGVTPSWQPSEAISKACSKSHASGTTSGKSVRCAVLAADSSPSNVGPGTD